MRALAQRSYNSFRNATVFIPSECWLWQFCQFGVQNRLTWPRSSGDRKANVTLIINLHPVANRAENFVKIGRVSAEIVGLIRAGSYLRPAGLLLGPFHGAIAVLSVTRCRCRRRRRGHRCAGGVRQ